MNKKFAERIFDLNELKIIEDKVASCGIDNIAYCSIENRFAKSGGLAAVVTTLLPYLQSKAKVVLFTPFHSKLKGFKNPPNNFVWKEINSIKVPFVDMAMIEKDIEVKIFKCIHKYEKSQSGEIEEFYLKADGFFEAENRLNDPYIYNIENNNENSKLLFRDAAFFCKAVPHVAEALGLKKNIVFHLQEWQTSLITLTSKEALAKGKLDSCKCPLTLHNTFDSFVTDDLYFRDILTNTVEIQRRTRIDSIISPEKHSVLSFALELIDTPVTTVSKSFAKEFIDDKVQGIWFASHLQQKFKEIEIIGINNGKFINSPPVIVHVFEGSNNKDRHQLKAGIKEIKQKFRKELLIILDEYKPTERFGELTYRNDSILTLDEKVPIFLMSGRLDPGQKGYDILLRVIEKIGKEDERAKFVLTPLPVRNTDLNYFYDVAKKCKGNVTVFPMRMERGYNELQMGSSYGLMPSIYEPFGAAIEYMVNGTVNIARNTGGLKDQIVDNESGLLYSENPEFKTEEEIKNFFSLSLDVEKRFEKKSGWAEAMANKLHEKIEYAIKIFETDAYYEMIINGFEKSKEFDWTRSTNEYFDVFQKNDVQHD